MSCTMPRASKAFPKEQVELLKAEAADAFINIALACGGPALDALVGLARSVEAEPCAITRPFALRTRAALRWS